LLSPVSSNPTGVIAPFSFTGNDQVLIVPPNIIQLDVKVWGAGGGGPVNYGQNGGFTSCSLPVTPGEALTIIVGEGGKTVYPGRSLPSYGGGGAGCSGYDAYGYYAGSSGGGRSAIQRNGQDVVVSGGGSGGAADWYSHTPGYGDYPKGSDCVQFSTDAKGGTQSEGGAGCTGYYTAGSAGSKTNGGSGGCDSYGGGILYTHICNHLLNTNGIN